MMYKAAVGLINIAPMIYKYAKLLNVVDCLVPFHFFQRYLFAIKPK